jgi:hypothetical protein
MTGRGRCGVRCSILALPDELKVIGRDLVWGEVVQWQRLLREEAVFVGYVPFVVSKGRPVLVDLHLAADPAVITNLEIPL